jgi:hypothetical protein
MNECPGIWFPLHSLIGMPQVALALPWNPSRSRALKTSFSKGCESS